MSSETAETSRSDRSENADTPGDSAHSADNIDCNGDKKNYTRKGAKVRAENVSLPIHFEHLVHIESLHSNDNNFASPKVSNDPVVKDIFRIIEGNIVNTLAVNSAERTAATSEYSSINQCKYPKYGTNQKNKKMNDGKSSNFFVESEKKEFVVIRRPSKSLSCSDSCSNDSSDSPTTNSISPLEAAEVEVERSDIPISQRFSESSIKLPALKTYEQMVSTDSSDTWSPMLPITPSMILDSYEAEHEAAYKAIVERSRSNSKVKKTVIESVNKMPPLHEKQECLERNSGTSSAALTKEQNYDIQQALRQLDDILGEEISLESSTEKKLYKSSEIQSSKCLPLLSSTNDNAISNACSSTSQKSVKELAKILDSDLRFGTHEIRFSDDMINEREALATKNKMNKPPLPKKPSSIGYNIFNPGTSKPISEIVAEKQKKAVAIVPQTRVPPRRIETPALVSSAALNTEKKNEINTAQSPKADILSRCVSLSPNHSPGESMYMEKSSPAGDWNNEVALALESHVLEVEPELMNSNESNRDVPPPAPSSSKKLLPSPTISFGKKFATTARPVDLHPSMILANASDADAMNNLFTEKLEANRHAKNIDRYARIKRLDSVDHQQCSPSVANISTGCDVSATPITDESSNIRWRNINASIYNSTKPVPPTRRSSEARRTTIFSQKTALPMCSEKSTKYYSAFTGEQIDVGLERLILNQCATFASNPDSERIEAWKENANTSDTGHTLPPKRPARKVDSLLPKIEAGDKIQFKNEEQNGMAATKKPVPLPRLTKMAKVNDDTMRESLITVAKDRRFCEHKESNCGDWILKL